MKYVLFALPLLFAACNRSSETKVVALSKEAANDVPLLPVQKGDIWEYEVHLEIPEGASAAGSAAVDTRFHRTRVYLGKVIPGANLPETDCFEVTAPGAPTEREFVSITDDQILMHGSLMVASANAKPMWLAKPIPFVVAGMKAGTELPEISAMEGAITRKLQVVAREEIAVPAGKFHAIRLLMTGKEGPMELRRTTWFAPGTGIVKEEKIHYRQDKVIYRETHELLEKKSAK